MKAWQIFSLGILALLSQRKHHVAAIYTMAETCKFYPTGFIGDSENCGQYAYCQDGVLLAKGQKCKTGYTYDKTTGLCTAGTVTCGNSVAAICKSLVTPEYVPDPTTCNTYCKCNGKGTSDGCATCPKYQIYNPTTERCDWESTSTYNCPANSVCRLLPNGAFAADPANCGGYVACKDGASFPSTCPPNYMYNATQQLCVPTASFDQTVCSGAPVQIGNECEGKGGDQDDAVYVPDNTCYGYFACTGSKKGVYNKCPYGTHFNPTVNECVTPYTYKCPADRCGNLNLMFVTDTTVTGCTNYVWCQGNSTAYPVSQPCPPDFPAFNEYSGICQLEAPTYTICT